MRLISTTLAGPGTEAIIGDALRSVAGWVDACLVVWTGGDSEEEIAVCNAVQGAMVGRSWAFRQWSWRDDFAEARNAALDMAAELGAEWALTCDTDERIALNGEDLGAALSAEVGAWLVRDATEGYAKERLIRLPASRRWFGRTHEAYPGHLDSRGRGTLERMSFTELPKTPEQMAAKFARDERLLRRELIDSPLDARWRYYMGVTLRGLGCFEEAIDEFRWTARLSSWPEEAASACFEAGRLYETLGRYAECLDACCSGMRHHPGLAELQWLAGVACLRLGKLDEARAWAGLAKVHGLRGDGVALRARLLPRFDRAIDGGHDEILEALNSRSPARPV